MTRHERLHITTHEKQQTLTQIDMMNDAVDISDHRGGSHIEVVADIDVVAAADDDGGCTLAYCCARPADEAPPLPFVNLV